MGCPLHHSKEGDSNSLNCFKTTCQSDMEPGPKTLPLPELRCTSQIDGLRILNPDFQRPVVSQESQAKNMGTKPGQALHRAAVHTQGKLSSAFLGLGPGLTCDPRDLHFAVCPQETALYGTPEHMEFPWSAPVLLSG